MTAVPPPGWHRDPLDRRRVRYWDGSLWTEHVHVVEPAVVYDDDPLAVGEWFEKSRVSMQATIAALWAPFVTAWTLFSALLAFWLVWLLDTGEATRLGDLLDVDNGDGAALDSAFVDLWWTAFPGFVACFVLYIGVVSWCTGVSAAATDAHMAHGEIVGARSCSGS